MFNSIQDAQTAMVNDGLFDAVNLDFENEIAEYMYRNDVTLEQCLQDNPEWSI